MEHYTGESPLTLSLSPWERERAGARPIATASPLPGGEGQGEGSDVRSLRELFGSGHAGLRRPQAVQKIAYQVTLTTSCSEVSPWRALSSAASRISLKPVLIAARRISSVEARATIISLISGLSIRISAVTVRPR